MDTLTDIDDPFEAFIALELLELETLFGLAKLLAERLRHPAPLTLSERDLYERIRRDARRSLTTLASCAPRLTARGWALSWIGELQRARRGVIDLADQLLSRDTDHVIDLT